MDIMNTENVVYILVVVDAGRAVSSNDLKGSFYLFSTSGYHGTGKPTTTVRKGDKIIWRAMSIDATLLVEIAGFAGPAVPGMVNPAPMNEPGPPMWSSLVTRRGLDVPYEMTLVFNETKHSCTCMLTTVEPRSEADASEQGSE